MFRRLQSRIFFALLLPVLGAAYFAVTLLVDRYQGLQQTNQLETAVESIPAITALVHELQRERGLSAGFIGARGGEFTAPLTEQRLRTDEALATLKSQVGHQQFPATLTLGPALRAWDGLKDIRTRVSSQTIPVSEEADWYSSAIRAHLNILRQVGDQTPSPFLRERLTALVLLSRAKESMGLERAMGSNGFGAGRFALPVYQKFVGLLAEQEIYLNGFRDRAPQEWKNRYEDYNSGDAFAEVRRMQDIALGGGLNGETQGVSGKRWFNTITGKIDRMRELENIFIQEYQADYASLREQERHSFYTQFLVMSGLSFAVFLFGASVIRSISQPILSLTEAVGKVTEGDYQVAIPCVGNQDEIGTLARSIDVLKRGARAMERQRWIKANVAETGTLLQSATTPQELAEILLSRLIPALAGEDREKGGIGHLYLFDPEEKILKLQASYGYMERIYLRNRIAWGEGLAGQCAFEGQPINQHDLDGDYPRIPLSSGSVLPVMATARPILSHDGLLGVVEIATLHKLDEDEQELIDALCQSAAIALGLLQRHAPVDGKSKGATDGSLSAQDLADQLFG